MTLHDYFYFCSFKAKIWMHEDHSTPSNTVGYLTLSGQLLFYNQQQQIYRSDFNIEYAIKEYIQFLI